MVGNCGNCRVVTDDWYVYTSDFTYANLPQGEGVTVPCGWKSSGYLYLCRDCAVKAGWIW